MTETVLSGWLSAGGGGAGFSSLGTTGLDGAGALHDAHAKAAKAAELAGKLHASPAGADAQSRSYIRTGDPAGRGTPLPQGVDRLMTNSSEATRSFELVTWYDTWNKAGLQNLRDRRVPLQYATRYNLAFGNLAKQADGAYGMVMGEFAEQVKDLILEQAPGAEIFASTRPDDSGIREVVEDNRYHNNRSTTAIVDWLKANGYRGLVIDEEDRGVMKDVFKRDVPHFIEQLGPSFKKADLDIVLSAPWPNDGPRELYGPRAVEVFKAHVTAIELQDYSSGGTSADANRWIAAGIPALMLLGGVCTERDSPQTHNQTSLKDTKTWTKAALDKGLRGMFSWRLDNDHGGEGEDVEPTFVGAKTVYETVHPPT